MKAAPSWPTSVRGSASRDPVRQRHLPLASGSSVTSVAVAVTRLSGRSDSRTQPVPISPASSSASREDDDLGERQLVQRRLDRSAAAGR